MPGDSEKESSMNCVLSKIIVRVSGTRQTLPLPVRNQFSGGSCCWTKGIFPLSRASPAPGTFSFSLASCPLITTCLLGDFKAKPLSTHCKETRDQFHPLAMYFLAMCPKKEPLTEHIITLWTPISEPRRLDLTYIFSSTWWRWASNLSSSWASAILPFATYTTSFTFIVLLTILCFITSNPRLSIFLTFVILLFIFCVKSKWRRRKKRS